MKTRTLHRALSMLLTVAMVLNMGLTPVFAAEGTPPGVSGVCTHHTEHDETCGYQQGTSCNHEHTEDCYTKELTCKLIEGDAPAIATDSEATLDSAAAHTHTEDCYTKTDNCKHEHNEACGYTPDTACRFDPASCTECKPSDKPAEKVCTCPPVDSGEQIHGEDCPLFAPQATTSAAVTALIAMVDALPNVADITEDNKEATLPAFEAAAEAYGALSDEDKPAFEETEQYTKLMALRDVLYSIALMKNEATWDISTGTLTIDGTCGADCTHTVTGKSDSIDDKIIVTSGTHNVTLNGVNILRNEDNVCAFEIKSGTVNLTLTGTNTLKSGKSKAGLQVTEGNTLSITAESTGSLSANGGSQGAGIGGGSQGAGGNITISGGKVDAIGGLSGAGIGGGSQGAGGNITINGGQVTATCGSSGAGIGGGSQGAGGNITINGGQVTATSKYLGAGIGGGSSGAGGTITINGGQVTATGGDNGAGIGGGGVGSTGGGGGGVGGAGGNITISGGAVVYAVKGSNATKHIGEAMGGKEGTVTKTRGIIFEGNAGKIYGNIMLSNNLTLTEDQSLVVEVNTTLIIPIGITLHNNGVILNRGNIIGTVSGNSPILPGAPVTLDISNGSDYVSITQTGYKVGAAESETPHFGDYIITGTANSTTNSSHVTISEGTHNITLQNANIQVSEGAFAVEGNSTVNLTLEGANVLSSGNHAGLQVQAGNTLTITGASTGSLTATGGTDGAGIGGGYAGTGGTITINGGTVTATGGSFGAGIGGGGGSNSTGIGGGSAGAGGTITINGGTVTAAGGSFGAGIGGGGGDIFIDSSSPGGTGGNVTVDGNVVVFAKGGNKAQSIGGGYGYGDVAGSGTLTQTCGVIFKDSTGTVYGNPSLPANLVVSDLLTVPAGATLTIPAGATLTIPAGVTLENNTTLTNNGAIVNIGAMVNSNTLAGTGSISGGGTVQTRLDSSLISLDQSSYVYTGSAIKPIVTVATTPWKGSTSFVQDTDYTVGYTNNTAVGKATVTVTPKGSNLTGAAVNKTFTITKSASALTLTTDKTDNTVTYGDTITFAANVSIPTTKARAAAVNTVDFYCDGTKLNDSTITLTESGGTGSATFTYDTTGKGIPVGGDIEITAQYGGSNNLNGVTQTVNVTLNPKPLTATVNTSHASATKVYNGNANFTGVALTLTGLETVDSAVTATASGTAANANVNASKAFTATGVTLLGTSKDCYTFASSAVTGNVAITAATPTIKVTAAKKAKSFFRSIGDHNDTIVLTATTGGVNGEKPNGSVVFKNGGTKLATVSTTNGVATYDWASPPAGNITVTADFTASSSETNYTKTAVTGTADAFDIDKGAQSALTVNVPALTYGDTGKSLTTSGGSTGSTVSYNVTGDCVTVGADGAITVVKAGTAKVTATMLGNSDFNDVTSKEETITVNPATPTVSWGSYTAQTVTYTGTAAKITPPTVTGIAVGDTSNGVITYQHKSTAVKLTNLFGLLEGYTAGLPTDAGEYKIVATVAADGNYAAADSGEMTLTINKITSTLTINSMAGKDYDGIAIADPTNITSNITNPTVTYTYYKDNGSGAKGDKLSGAPKAAGKYWVEGSIAETGNTTAITSDAVSFTVEKAPLTITGGTFTQREYDGTTAATVTDLTFGGLKNGETLSITTDYTAGTPVYNSADAGTDKTVSGTAALESNAKTSNYTLTGAYSITNQTIAKKTGIAAPTYAAMDNTTTAKSFTFNTVSGYDTVTDYEWKLDTDADSAWASVTTNPITFGNRAGKMQVRVKGTTNYEAGAILTHGTAFTATLEGSVSIDGTATYGETLTATPTGTQTGAVLSYEWKSGGAVLQAKSTSNTYKIAGAAVGKVITVEVTAASYTGSLTDTTATVEKKAVTATATIISKVYDSTAAVELADRTLTIAKVNTSDDITVTMPDATYDNKNVGTGKTITMGDLTITGAAKAWYTVTAPTGVTGEITAKPLANSMISGINASYPYTGSAIAPTPTVTDGDPSIITTSDYTVSHEANTNAGTAKVVLTGKGNYSGTAEKSFTIAKAEQAAFTIDAVTGKKYNDVAFILSTTGGSGTGAVSFSVPANNGVLTVSGSNATIVGVGTVTLSATKAADGNYNVKTATLDITIAKAAAPSITYPAASGLTYGAKLSTSALTGGSTTYGSFAWEDGSIVPTVANSGYSVKFTPSEATLKNYEVITPLTQTVSVAVAKVTPAIDLKAQVSGDTGSRKATLTATLTKVGDGEIPTGTVKFVNSTGSDADIETVSITNGVAAYTWTGLADQAYKVKAVYSGSGNYQIATATEISFDTRKQNQQNFAIAAIGTKTYGDGAFALSTSGGNGSGAVSFTSSDSSLVSISGNTATIHKAGNVTITANKAADVSYNEATATASLTVNKKAISFIANDMPKVVKGSQMPTFTYKPVALATGDSITTEPTLTTTAADTNTLGKFAITISGAVVTNADSYTITYVNGEMTVVEQLYTVTVTDGTGGGQYSEGQTVSITANNKNGYTFTIWTATPAVTFANASLQSTTFTMPASAVTITPNWTYNGGGGTGDGGSTGGGGGGSTPTPPVTPENANPPTTAETGVNSKTDKNGNATAAASEKDITNAIEKAQKEAKKNGTEANGIAITLDVGTDKKATSLNVTLPQKSVSELITAKVTEVTVKNGLSTVTLDLATLKALAGGDVILNVGKADTTKLSKETQAAIGNRPVFQYGITVGGKAVSDFKGGKAGLQIPYTPTTNEQIGNLCGVYVDDSGKVNWLEASSYDPITGMMLISAQHFSTYGVGYKQSTPKFTDVGTHWAKNDIDFVVARGLLTGTSNTTFAPDTSMTRGMFVTALGRLAGVDTKKYQSTKFTDVAATAYYSPYVAWASANNIVTGTSDTTFSPDKAITRQEMAVMLVNYSKAIGYKLPSVHAEVTFTDAGSIASWAKSAVKQTQMAGILTGKSGNRFDPTATATRAEVSAMLRRYVELVVNTETAEGWAMNESGQWMYIENGKRTTGSKTIGGKSYTFDQFGVTTALPPERKYLSYTVQAGDSFWSIARKYKVSMFELAKVNGKTIFSVIHAGDELKVPQQ